jgi:hypothetical protein
MFFLNPPIEGTVKIKRLKSFVKLMSKNSNSGYYTMSKVFKLILYVNRLGTVLIFTQISAKKYSHERRSSYPLAPDCWCCPLVEHSRHCTLNKLQYLYSSPFNHQGHRIIVSLVGENDRSVRFLLDKNKSRFKGTIA